MISPMGILPYETYSGTHDVAYFKLGVKFMYILMTLIMGWNSSSLLYIGIFFFLRKVMRARRVHGVRKLRFQTLPFNVILIVYCGVYQPFATVINSSVILLSGYVLIENFLDMVHI